jgi:hypothetical protein
MWPPLFLSTALQSHSIQIKSFSRSRCLFHSNFVAKIARDEDFDVGFFFGQFCQTRLGSRWYSSLMIEQVITLQCLCFLFLLAIELRGCDIMKKSLLGHYHLTKWNLLYYPPRSPLGKTCSSRMLLYPSFRSIPSILTRSRWQFFQEVWLHWGDVPS